MFLSILIGFASLYITAKGIKKSFERKSITMFFWMLLFYFSFTALCVCCFNVSYDWIFGYNFDIKYIDVTTRRSLLLNILLCNLGFYFGQWFFRKKIFGAIDINEIPPLVQKIIIFTFWISLGLFVISHIGTSYDDYVNDSTGGGWPTVFFEVSCGAMILFYHNKNWLQLALGVLGVLYIVIFNNVRSLMFFPVFPIVLYYLLQSSVSSSGFNDFLKKSSKVMAVVLLIAFGLSVARFGLVELPDANLWGSALEILQNGDSDITGQPLYFNSFLNYVRGLFVPIENMLRPLGVNQIIEAPLSLPKMMGVNKMQVSSYDVLEGLHHYPATLYFDLQVSWWQFAPIAACLIMMWLEVLCGFIQRNALTFVMFASLFGWHAYSLNRGSVDMCTTGIIYPCYVALIFIWVVKKFFKSSNKLGK